MKKMKTSAIVMMLGLSGMISSCGSGQKSAENSDTTVTVSLTDSMSVAYGDLMGAFFNRSIIDAEAYDTTVVINKKEFLSGMEAVLSQECSEDYIAGMMAAMQMEKDMSQYKEQGLKLNRTEVMARVRRLVLMDSVSDGELDAYRHELEAVQQKFNAIVERRQEARVRQLPEARANDNAGRAVADRALKSGAVKTSSGLVAQIVTPGTGKIDPSTPLVVNIALKHVDGKVINSASGVQIMPKAQYEGIVEALGMLGLGGKGTFYLPPELGMGINGIPEMQVGPMEWLVFDVEILGEVASPADPTTTTAVHSTPVAQDK